MTLFKKIAMGAGLAALGIVGGVVVSNSNDSKEVRDVTVHRDYMFDPADSDLLAAYADDFFIVDVVSVADLDHYTGRQLLEARLIESQRGLRYQSDIVYLAQDGGVFEKEEFILNVGSDQHVLRPGSRYSVGVKYESGLGYYNVLGGASASVLLDEPSGAPAEPAIREAHGNEHGDEHEYGHEPSSDVVQGEVPAVAKLEPSSAAIAAVVELGLPERIAFAPALEPLQFDGSDADSGDVDTRVAPPTKEEAEWLNEVAEACAGVAASREQSRAVLVAADKGSRSAKVQAEQAVDGLASVHAELKAGAKASERTMRVWSEVDSLLKDLDAAVSGDIDSKVVLADELARIESAIDIAWSSVGINCVRP